MNTFAFKRAAGGLRKILAAALLSTAAGLAAAQDFPSKTVRLLTPYPPGGSTDATARVIAPKMATVLGQQVLVEAMPGANGAVALNFLAKAPADGYTILVTTASPIVINPHTFPNIPYDALKDFVAVSTVARTETALVVNPDVPANNLEELFALAKQRDIHFGVAGLGGQPQIVVEKMKLDTGSRFVIVPYAGGGPAVTDTVGGHVDAVVNDVAPLIPLVNDGRLKGIAVLTDKEKSEFLPGVPTLAGNDAAKDYTFHSWLVLLAPANTPADVLETLRKSLVEAMKSEDVIKAFRNVGLIPFPSDSAEQATQFVADEFNHFKDIVAETGVHVQN